MRGASTRPDSLTGKWCCSRTKLILIESLGPALIWKQFFSTFLAGTLEHLPSGCLILPLTSVVLLITQERMAPHDEEGVAHNRENHNNRYTTQRAEPWLA